MDKVIPMKKQRNILITESLLDCTSVKVFIIHFSCTYLSSLLTLEPGRRNL